MTADSPTGPPPGRLILLHGFTQNADCWGPFGQALSAEPAVETVAVDAPGHGRAGNDDADLWTAADLAVEAGGTGVYLGYSMGGRIALHAALSHPEAVRGLVLIGATAGIDDAAERAARRAADDSLAERLLADGLERFLDRWLANPLFAGLTDEQACRSERLANRADGLAASLRNCGTGNQEPLWDRLGQLTIPVLVISGQDDTKFTALGRRLVESLSRADARLATIPGTHAVHLEQPTATAGIVLDHLAATARRYGGDR
jgi:2-succinyl-6-hydroxy-2,4-cyclohexadiene-1-carboxylate synthase